MERLPNSVFLVLRNDNLIHIWGQVKITVMICSHRSWLKRPNPPPRILLIAASVYLPLIWAPIIMEDFGQVGNIITLQLLQFLIAHLKGDVNFFPRKLERIDNQEFNVSAFHYPPKVKICIIFIQRTLNIMFITTKIPLFSILGGEGQCWELGRG